MVAGRYQFPERYDSAELQPYKPLLGKHFTFNEVNTRHLDKKAGMWSGYMQGYHGGAWDLNAQGSIPRFLTSELVGGAAPNIVGSGRYGIQIACGGTTNGGKVLYKKTRDVCIRLDQSEWPDVMLSVVFRTQNKNNQISGTEKITFSWFGFTDIDSAGTGLPGASAHCIYWLVTSHVFDFDNNNAIDAGCRTSNAGVITNLKDMPNSIVIADTFNQISEALEMSIVVRNSYSKRAVEFYMRGARVYSTAEATTPNLPTGQFLYPFFQHFGFGVAVSPCSSWFAPSLVALNDRELP